MRIVKQKSTEEFVNGSTCIAREYRSDDSDINGAVVTVSGRYPQSGFVTNQISKELGYVMSGSGKLILQNGETHDLKTGDVVILSPGEIYAWESDALEMLMVCTPAWIASQHKEIPS